MAKTTRERIAKPNPIKTNFIIRIGVSAEYTYYYSTDNSIKE